MIVTHGLTKHHGETPAVDDLSCHGQSTTIMGLDSPGAGRALVNGACAGDHHAALHEVGRPHRVRRHRARELPLHKWGPAPERWVLPGLRPTNQALAGFALASLVVGTFALVLGLISFFVGQAVLSGAAPTAALNDPGVRRALVESAAFLGLLALSGVGIGAIIRHGAGAIATFVGCTLLLPLILHNLAGDPMPVLLLGNSVAAVVPISGAPSGTAALLLMTLYAGVALGVGAARPARRDA